jgi:hypothetical protein
MIRGDGLPQQGGVIRVRANGDLERRFDDSVFND